MFKVCKGDLKNIAEMKKLDIFDFWDYVENMAEDGRRNTDNKSRQH